MGACTPSSTLAGYTKGKVPLSPVIVESLQSQVHVHMTQSFCASRCESRVVAMQLAVTVYHLAEADQKQALDGFKSTRQDGC